MLNKKSEFKKFRKDLDEALSDLMDQYGFRLEQGNLRYSSSEMSMRLTFKDGGNLSENEFLKKEFVKNSVHCPRINEEDFGQKFKLNGNVFKLIKINSKARKYPLVVKQLNNGKQYKIATKVYKNAEKTK